MTELPAIRVEQHRITTRDNIGLVATLYRPVEVSQTIVLIAPAMGVKQSFYRHYANFLAEQGFITLTFDYRGIGQSLKGNIWSCQATILQWGAEDLQTVLAWLLRQYPDCDLRVVGHSLGTKILGLSRSNYRVKGLLGISSGNIYWKLWPFHRQPALLLFWYILLPLSTYAMGYFPANFFGLGEKLPREIGSNWARMARNRYSVIGMYGDTENDHYSAFEGDFTLYTFSDDSFIPKQAGDELLAYYPHAQNKQHHRINPLTIGQKTVGHFGFFRPELRDSLWQETADWLRQPYLRLEHESFALPSLQTNEAPQAG